MDQEFMMLTLPNGLRVLLIPMKDVGVTYMELAVRCGFLSEGPGTFEYAHFLEHMQAQYTSSKNRSSSAINDSIEAAGAVSNASTWYDETRYYITSKKEDSLRFLDLMLTSFVDYKMDEETLEAEREAIVTELMKRSGNDPWHRLKEALNEYAYGKKRMATMEERIDSTKEATIEGLFAFRDRYYVPENMLLTVSGEIDNAAVMSLVEKTVATLRPSLPAMKPSSYFVPPKNLGPVCFFVENDSVASSFLSISWSLEPRPYDLGEINTGKAISWILTSGMRSRLMHRLRTELKAVYGISASMDVVNFGQSTFSIETEVDAKHIPLILKEVLKEVLRLKEELIEHEEFDRVKNKIIMANRLTPLSIEPTRYASQYSDYVLWDQEVVTFRDKLASFETVTPSDVQKFVENNLVRSDNLIIAYSGSQDRGNKIEKLIPGVRIVSIKKT